MVARQSQRFPALFPGSLVCQNRTHPVKLSDISRNGCRLQSSLRPVSGMMVGLLLYIPGEDVPLLIQQATVRWAGTQGIGIEFEPLPWHHRKRLDAVVKQLEITFSN